MLWLSLDPRGAAIGRIVEDGHHDQLVSRDGPYAAMFATWASEGGPPAWREPIPQLLA